MEKRTLYQLSSSVRDEIVEIVITGEIPKNALDGLRVEILAILQETKAKAMLLDSRTAKGPTEIIDAYFRARSIPLDVKINIKAVAIVEPAEHRDFQSFYETTAANIGLKLKYFTEIEPARAWLKSELEGKRRE